MEILVTTTTIYFLSGVLIFCVFFLIFILFYKVEESDEQTTSKSKAAAKKTPKKQNIFEQAAVASTTEICTNIVTEIFKKGGSVADASITALLCEGICSPQSMGVGGGFLLTYYEKSVRKAYVLNARECAPENTKPDMYRSLSSPASGGLAVAVPGEILGYWDLHRRFGKLPWKDLFEPVIRMCREGFVLNKFAAQSFANMRSYIMNSPTLKEIFVNPTTGDVFKPGEKMTRPQLADTFEVIANEGPQALYDGKLTDAFIKDIEEHGGIITKSDMKNYRTNWTNPVQMQLPGHNTIYSVPSPGSGSVLLMILDVLFGLGKTDDPGMNWFRIVETWKHAFGFRSNLDGPLITDTSVDCDYDPSFAKSTMNKIASEEKTSEDVRHYTTEYEKVYHEGGTCHISLIAPNGDAISVTSSINYALGAMFASKSTGMIMNNQMMDFAIPEYHDKYYKYNQIAPNKQPVSCMIPTIIIDRRSGDVRLVVGSAGGFKIISSTSQLILETLLYDVPVEEAIIHPRLHHQLVPMVLFYENDFPPDVLAQLRKYGHHLEKIKPATSGAIISVTKDGIEAVGDPRRFGSSGGIYGAMFTSQSTGIILNNHMMDFHIPYHDKFYKNNAMAPFKQPASCMIPTVIVNNKTGKVRMVVGSAGASRIITSTSQVIVETLLYEVSPAEAIAHPRLHHQLVPMVLIFEPNFPTNIVDKLKNCGHIAHKHNPCSSVALISVTKAGIEALGDPRRNGSSDGF